MIPGARPKRRLSSRLLALIAGIAGASCGHDLPSDTDQVEPYVPTEETAYPIAVSHGDLVDAGGHALVLVGDTPWSLAVQLDSAHVLAYLDKRASQGVNALAFNAIEHLFGDRAPKNAYGQSPFRGELAPGILDFTALDPTYWAFIEWIVTEARSRGMVVFLFPAYVGYQFNDQGWSREMRANGPARLRSYGDSLGRRLGSAGNLVWVMGGDWGPTYQGVTLRSEIAALVQGIAARAPGSIFTAHASRNQSALDAYGEPWLDINTTYSDTLHGPSRLLADALRTSGPDGADMPTIWIEGYYENEHDMTDERLRAQLYWSLLSGGTGHFYGAFPVWSFDAPEAATFGDPHAAGRTWSQVLDSRFANELAVARTLVDSLPLEHLAPMAHAGLWPSETTPSAPTVGWAPSDSLLVAYVRGGRRLDLTPTHLHAMRGTWVDPRTGERTPVETNATDTFSPPSRDDWILVLRGVTGG